MLFTFVTYDFCVVIKFRASLRANTSVLLRDMEYYSSINDCQIGILDFFTHIWASAIYIFSVWNDELWSREQSVRLIVKFD